MRWVKISDWFVETECEKYRCRKRYPGDVVNDPGERRYQLYRHGLTLGSPQLSFADCRRIAQADADKAKGELSHE